MTRPSIHIPLLVAALLCTAGPLAAQDASGAPPLGLSGESGSILSPMRIGRHVSHLFYTPGFAEELAENTRKTDPATWNAMCDTTRFSSPQPHLIGDRRDFFVTNFLDRTYGQVTAELRAVAGKLLVYVDVRELSAGHISQEFIDDSLVVYLTQRVPRSGVSADGIISYARELFGDPPDVDRDSTVEILLYDIVDGYTGNGSEFVAGYFNPLDQTTSPGSNRSDIIYLDTSPTIYPSTPLSLSLSLQSFAHEYQHLIHYGHDPREIRFFDEGCSMELEYLCGFVRIDVNAYFTDTNTPLLGWDTTQTVSAADLARAQYFTLYLERQFGVSFLKSFVADTLHGFAGLTHALAEAGDSATAEQVFEWWTVANQVQNSTIDPRYGYRGIPISEDLTEKHPAPLHVYPTEQVSGRDSVQPLSSVYLSFRDAGYFVARFLGSASLRIYAAADTSVIPIPLDVLKLVPGIHKEVVFVVSNTSPDSTLTFLYGTEQRSASTELRYDTGQPDTMLVDGQKTGYMMVDNSIAPGGAAFALAFKPVENSTLIRTRYFVGFGQEIPGNSTPPSAPRSFIAHIWKSLRPEPAVNLIAPQRQTVDRTITPVNTWYDIPLTENSMFLTGLIDTVFVGFEDADLYATGIGLTQLAGPPSHTWFFTGKSWAGGGGLDRSKWYSFNDLSWGTPPNSVSLSRWDIMIRTVWMKPLNAVDRPAMPASAALDPNYPNPFPGRTTLRFRLTRLQPVALSIYDLLGRKITTLLEGEYGEGVYIADWDGLNDRGERMASGFYFCELRAGNARFLRTLHLLR